MELGKISQWLGTGKNATIYFSGILMLSLVFVAMLSAYIFEDFSMSGFWEKFIPLFLAYLGYVFGKKVSD